MSDTVAIRIQSIYDAKGSQAATQAINQLVAASQKAAGGALAQSSQKAAGGLAQQATAAQRAQAQILSLAQAEARLLSTQGQNTAAFAKLNSAIAQSSAGAVQLTRAKTQLAQIDNKLSGQSQSLTSLFQGQSAAVAGLGQQLGQLGGSAGGLASSFGALAGSLGTVGSVGAAIGIGKVAIDLATVGANAALVRTRFDGLATTAGTTGDALLKALRAGSGGEISDLNLQLAANKAQLLGVASSAEQFGTLMSIARDRAQQMGISTTQAFDDLTTGLGRGSKLILDNLGILVNTDQANQAYAASIGKTVAALTDQERKQALINQVLKDGQATIAQTGGAVESTASQIAQGQVAFENLKASVGELAAIRLGPLAEDVGAVVNALAGSGDRLAAIGSGIDLAGKINPMTSAFQSLISVVDSATGSVARFAGLEVRDNFSPLRESLNQWLQLLGLAPAATQQVVSAVDTMEEARARETAATNMAADTMEAYRGIEAASIAAQQQAAAATLNYATAFGAYEQAARAASGAQQEQTALTTIDIAKKLEAEQQTQKLAQIQQTLASLGPAVAGGMQTAASAAAFLAVRYNLAYSEAIRLINAQAALANVKPAGPMAGIVEDRLTRDTPADRAQVKSDQALEANRKLLASLNKTSAARVSSAGATAAKLESIEVKTGDKIASIVEDTQKKITAIAEREAAKQQAALQKLNESIATAAADRRASNEADDLDLIGVTDPKEAARLNDRERAQAKAREAEKRAAEEARATALAGDAELAQKQYEIREKQIGDQQALDEKYADKQRELAENPDALAAAKTQYDEATRANEEAAQVRIDLAKAESDQKAAALQAEKDAVIAAAEDQANKVVGAAERSAQGVAKASQSAKDIATANLRAIGDAVNAIPAQKTITITVNQEGQVGASSASGGGGGANKAAGGGTFLTSGPTTLTVGDNPGGVEVVSVTPISGTGQTRVGGGLAKLAGGGVVVVDAGDGYTTPVAGTGKPAGGGGKGKGKGAPAPADPKALREAIKESIELIKLQNELRKVQAEAARLRPAPINYAWIEGLATEAQEITRIVTSKLLPLKKDEAEALSKYVSANGQAADVLHTIAELRTMQAKAKEERPGPIIEGYIVGLANEAQKITQIVRDRLIPSTELESEMYSAYADAVSSSTSILKDVADLCKVQADTVGTRGLLPNRDLWYIGLADEAVRIAKIVRARAVPASEEERDALLAFADVVGSSVGVLKDVSGLTAEMFTDYQSPSDAQLGRLVMDADRIAAVMTKAAARYDTKGLEAAKAYTDALGGTFGVIKDGLLAFDAINSGDFVLDPAKLAQFSDASLVALDTVSRLATRATQIPATSLTALEGATSALSGLAEAGVKLAAVPFGNLADISRIFSGGGGGNSQTNINNTFVLPPGSNRETANEVIRILSQQTSSRRA